MTSNVYLEDGTTVPVLRFDMGVTVTDLQTGCNVWDGDVPEHLSEHYSVIEAAEWATQWVDVVYGLSVVPDDTEDGVVTFGMLGHSYVEQFRAGARYLISVTVRGVGKGYTVTRNGEWGEDTYLSETAAVEVAKYVHGAVVGTKEITL